MSKSSDSKKTPSVPTNYLMDLKTLLNKLRDDHGVSNSDLAEVEGNLTAPLNQAGWSVLDYSISVSHVSNSVQVVLHTHSLRIDGKYTTYTKEEIITLNLGKTNKETNSLKGEGKSNPSQTNTSRRSNMKNHHTNLNENINQDLHAHHSPSTSLYISNKEVEGVGFLATVDEFTQTLLTNFVASREEVTNLVNNLINFAKQAMGEPTFKYEIQSLSGLGTTLVKMELTSGVAVFVSNIVHLGNNNSSPNSHAMNNQRYGSGPHGFNHYTPDTQVYFQHEAQMHQHQPHGLGQYQPGINHPLFSGPHHEHGYPYPRDPSQRYRWTQDDFEHNQPNAYEFKEEVEDEEKEEIQTESFDADESSVSDTNEVKDNDEGKE